MQFSCNSWKTIDELVSNIKSFANSLSTDIPSEIERKWTVDYSILEFLKTSSNAKKIRHLNNLQAYLSVNPEVRYRSAKNIDTGETYNYISYKTDGTICREEYELDIALSSALKFAKAIRGDKKIKEYRGSKFIIKDYWVFDIGDGKEIEISLVDNDKNFVYMEIEFPDIASAEEYKIPECIAKYIKKEVTNDDSFKMKNYWKRTRLNNK